MDEENERIINDALLSGPQSPHSPLLAPEAVEYDDSFEILPSSRDCLNDEIVTSHHQLAWGSPQEGFTLSPPYSHPTWDLSQCDDWLDVLSSPSDYEDEEITESPSSPSQPPWDLLQAGPSVHQTGLSYTQADPSHIQAGLHHRKNTIKSQSMVFECEHCKKAFSRRFNLWRHIRTAHEQNPKYLGCEYCGKRFIRTDNLQRHIKSMHSITKPDRTKHLPERFHCPSPREQLLQGSTGESGSTLDGGAGQSLTPASPSPTQLGFSHAQSGPSATKTGPFHIQAGPSLLENSRTIRCKIKYGTKIHKCDNCQKVFTRNSSLRRHIHAVHEGDPVSIVCNYCRKRFLRRDNLRTHIKNKHSSEKPEYLCSNCGNKFTTRASRNRHEKIFCSVVRGQSLIGYRADESANMDVDAETHEAGAQVQVEPDVVEPRPSTVPAVHPLPLVDGGVPNACARCGRQYSARSNLLRHLKYECGLPPQFCCQQCSFKTHRKRTLELHMFKRHGSISFQ